MRKETAEGAGLFLKPDRTVRFQRKRDAVCGSDQKRARRMAGSLECDFGRVYFPLPLALAGAGAGSALAPWLFGTEPDLISDD